MPDKPHFLLWHSPRAGNVAAAFIWAPGPVPRLGGRGTGGVWMSCEVIGSMDQKPEDRGIPRIAALAQVVCQVTREGAREEGQEEAVQTMVIVWPSAYPLAVSLWASPLP